MPRKFHFKLEYCELLRAHMGAGQTFKSFAAVIGCSYCTIIRWTYDHKAFDQVKKDADLARERKNQWSWRHGK